jgi:hypothetical protein
VCRHMRGCGCARMCACTLYSARSILKNADENFYGTVRMFHLLKHLRKYVGHAVAQLVEALPCSTEGHGFDS